MYDLFKKKSDLSDKSTQDLKSKIVVYDCKREKSYHDKEKLDPA